MSNLAIQNIFCQISGKLLKIQFLCTLMKLVVFFNGVYHFAKKTICLNNKDFKKSCFLIHFLEYFFMKTQIMDKLES